jgi:MFS family permease
METQPVAEPRRGALLIATSFLALFAIVGLCLYGLPFYYDYFVTELGWSRARVTSGNALGKLVVGPLFGFAAGWLIDRAGPKPLMLTGIALAGVALIGLGGVDALPFFFLFYLLNSLAYVLAGPLPNQVLLSRAFQVGRGRALGIAYLGIGLGGFAAQHVSKALIDAFGWRHALQALGGLVVLVSLPLVLRLKAGVPAVAASGGAPAPGARSSLPMSSTDPSAAASSVAVANMAVANAASNAGRNSLKGLLGKRSFHLLAFGSMASIGAVGGAFQNLKLLLSIDQHRSQEEAKWILSLILLASLVGRVVAGELADRYGPKRVMLLVYSLVTAALLILAFGSSGQGIYAFVLVFGLGLGGEYLIIPLVASELFGAAVLGRGLGIILTADGVAEAVVPMAVASLRDSTGTYTTGFVLLSLLAALGAVAISFLPDGKSRAVGGAAARSAPA